MEKIKFPYKKYFMQPPNFYYHNIIDFKPYYPNRNYYYFDNETGNKYYYDVIIGYDDSMYENIDMVTDYFNEKERIKAIVNGESYSPLDYYRKYEDEINDKFKEIKSNKIRMYQMREYIYGNVREATLFKISSVLSIMKYVEKDRNIRISDCRILDPSSGWGDRLIAFISLNAKEYIGFDPNDNLQKGYNKIIKTFTKLNKQNQIINDYHYQVIPDGFENSKFNNYFDIVFTSPPYFDVEDYDNSNKQSIKKYPTQSLWLNKFFTKYLKNCVKAVKPGGLIFIHISNNKHFKVVKFLMDQMDKLNVRKYKYFGLLGTNGRCFPVWSWIKN